MSQPPYGRPESISPGLRRILAPNPGPMTFTGTNTYIVGEGTVCVVDPGPDDRRHLDAILAATEGERISHICITHAHADHSPLSRTLSRITHAPVLGFGPPEKGRSEIMARLAETSSLGGGEGVDHEFRPDIEISDAQTIYGEGWSLDAIHTPGHFAGHLAFALNDTLISGDHVLGMSSTLISPPDGDLRSFMSTCARLLTLDHAEYAPGHGDVISDPKSRIEWLVKHRNARTEMILGTLTNQPQTIIELTQQVYSDTPPELHAAAARNVFAHLIEGVENGLVSALPSLSPVSTYTHAH